MPGSYCRYCGHRCFVERVLPNGRHLHMATCLDGAMHDLTVTGYTYQTARNPMEASNADA
jgi:hypothetical protein